MIPSLLVPVLFAAALPASKADPCYLLRSHPQSVAQWHELETRARHVLTERPRLGPVLAVVCGATALAELDDASRATRIVSQRERMALRRKMADSSILDDDDIDRTWFAEYRDLEAIESALETLEAHAPDAVQLKRIGESHEQRPIWRLSIGRQSAPARATTRILVLGTIHAREWISPMAALYVAARLSVDVQALLDDAVRVDVIPVVNPDGYAHTWDPEGDRFWRKNRNPEGSVDLNRNWAKGWGDLSGSSDDPDAADFHGDAPFSEPELVAVRDQIESEGGYEAFVDIHSFSQLVLHPPGFDYDLDDRADFESLARGAANAMNSGKDRRYIPMLSMNLYPATGTSQDWMASQHASLALTLELRPSSWDPANFELPADEIWSTAQEAHAAIQATIDAALGGKVDDEWDENLHRCEDFCDQILQCPPSYDDLWGESNRYRDLSHCAQTCQADVEHVADRNEDRGREDCRQSVATYVNCIAEQASCEAAEHSRCEVPWLDFAETCLERDRPASTEAESQEPSGCACRSKPAGRVPWPRALSDLLGVSTRRRAAESDL